MANEAGQVARILYKEIVEGDLRKIQAQSNDADTGGGARDFRFGSYKTLLPVIKQMFPQTVKENRKRGGQIVQIDVFKGAFSWRNAEGKVEAKESFFEPPTDVRPSEGRIARIHEYPCFDASKVKIGAGNRVLLLLIQLDDGSVWPHYAEEKSLRTPGAWHAVVAKELLDCLDADRPVNQAVIGYRDFTNADRYCNGK
ncbi:hypothetical protein J2W32_005769 [Variovorax boronicumulans]|uniref:Uncharacterized protein n=1 Tax=Variovorax boronicumulans TaxID=436515 RepID=A0AAW8D8S3_9BURK|nr:hypothetical protein [Variovorax boronicumulans]MDP9896659.1 hypothetical protein [Variovorax boronicumulans]MDQ0056700.1 hypothetical protein [Variovorax boronicumulans]